MMETRYSNAALSMKAAANQTTAWLCNVAAPIWSTVGRTPIGLFAERITLKGDPDSSYFRTFVQARHIFSFCAIGNLGWNGPWRELVEETVHALVFRHRRTDGFYIHRVDAAGAALDTRADLYDQAFVLFALGVAGSSLQRDDLFDLAECLLDAIERNWGHPNGGFREGEIVDPAVRRQNPHMHLLEAALALAEASGRERFRNLAWQISELAFEHMIDPATGAMLEYFNDDWSPAPGVQGREVEPGHCFEWAWLFERMFNAGWDKGTVASDRLTTFARNHGLCPTRGVAVNEILTDGSVHDGKARLWPQTERLKAAAARFIRTREPLEAEEAVNAAAGLQLYLNTDVKGLWRDKLREDGSWIEELAPGSSLYHIACAYKELATSADLSIRGPAEDLATVSA